MYESEIKNFYLRYTQYKGTKPEDDFTLDTYMKSHNPPLHQISYYEFSLDETDIFKLPTYDYSFDRPFLLWLRKEGSDLPYFAMWVDNADVMVTEN